MTQLIEIEGDLIRIIERSVVSQANLADTIGLIEHRPPITLFHPRSAIWTYWNESNPIDRKASFLCELPPGIRRIRKYNRGYRLALPWTYFLFSFQLRGQGSPSEGMNWSMVDYFVFHAPERIRDPRSRLWSAFLPNVYEDGRICFGSTGASIDQPLPDRIDQLVNEWYATEFNDDVIGGRSHPLPFDGRLPSGWRLWVQATTDHGLAAFSQFPEWQVTDGSIPSWTVEEIITGQGRIHHIRTPDRPRLGTVTEAIPEITMPFTVGRAAEWARTLEPTALHRIATAVELIREETPDAIVAPVDTIAIDDPQDDGSEPV